MPISDMSLMLHLDEGQGWGSTPGTELEDSSHQGNKVEIAGTDSLTWAVLDEKHPWADDVMFGDSALIFNSGKKAYVKVDDKDVLNPTSITMEVWIKLKGNPDCDGNNNWRYIITKGWNQYHLILEENRQISASFYVNGVLRRLRSTTQIPLNEYTFIAATYDNETGVGRLIINERVEKEEHWPPGNIASTSNELRIGNDVSGCPNGGGIPDAAIDEVRIYNRALSSKEIIMHYQGLY